MQGIEFNGTAAVPIAAAASSQPPPPLLNDNCDFAEHSDAKLSFRVLSQTVRVSEVNFAQRSFRVWTELQLAPVCADLMDVILDLGPDCILPNETGFIGYGRVTVNDVDAVYMRNRFGVLFDPTSTDRSIMSLKRKFLYAHSVYPGDLIIQIPEECMPEITQQMVIRVAVDVTIIAPKEGVIFSGKSDIPGAHFYTARSGLFSSTKHWLPCIESASQLAVWRLELTVPNEWNVAACGDLVDTIPCEKDESQKTFLYQILVPTSALNIGFVAGDFQMHIQPDISEIISYCPPGLLPLLKHTVSTLNRTFTFFEEVLSCRFPYGYYRLVFVDQLPENVNSFAGLSIFSLHMLYHKKIFDLVQTSRQNLAYAIAQQFFGCFVNASEFREFWLIKALSRYVSGLFVERFFGQSEYLFEIDKMLKAICDYELRYERIIVSPLKTSHSNPMLAARAGLAPTSTVSHEAVYYDTTLPDLCSPLYAEALYKKGHFILIMLQKRLGKELFLKVLQRILSVAMQYCQALSQPVDWSHMIVSTESFFRSITNITGRELPSFIEQWIHTGGHVRFEVNQTFNRKHNKLELEVRQSSLSNNGVQNYIGPLTIVIQELDGCFTHTIQVDAIVSKHDILCHSKGRKQKKKRIPLSTNEEVEIDLTQMDADSPVMWIRVDPEMLILRQVVLNQQVYQWEYMLRYERDVNAQMHAIAHLRNFPVHHTQNVLTEALENDKFFYKVRRAAAHSLVDVCNRLPEGLLVSQHPLIAYFQRVYGCKSTPTIPAPNNFVATSANLQHYFLMIDLPLAIGKIRGQGGMVCPHNVTEFLLSLLKLNDNSSNRYSDDYYRGNLISALGASLTLNDHEVRYPEMMREEARAVLTEAVHAINMDTMRPSFGRIVTINALYVIRNLQKMRYIPLDLSIFWEYVTCKSVFSQVRRAALMCIISSVQNVRNSAFSKEIYRLVSEVVLADDVPYIRQKTVEQLCHYPPFVGINDTQSAIYSTNTPELASLLWTSIADTSRVECRIRTSLIDLYYLMYGAKTPTIFGTTSSMIIAQNHHPPQQLNSYNHQRHEQLQYQRQQQHSVESSETYLLNNGDNTGVYRGIASVTNSSTSTIYTNGFDSGQLTLM